MRVDSCWPDLGDFEPGFDAFCVIICVIVDRGSPKTWQYRRRVAKSDTIVTLKLGAFPAYSVPDARE